MKLDTFVQNIKKANVCVSDVMCNGELAGEQQRDDNYRRIKAIRRINSGYDCSACDPLLLLISHIYHVDIVHKFNGVLIRYEYAGERTKVRNVLYFGSNTGHFWYSKKQLR